MESMESVALPPRQRRRLPRWRAALQRHRGQLSTITYDRYAGGLFPAFLASVLNDPDALEDLARALREEQPLPRYTAALFHGPMGVVMRDPDALEDLARDLREEQRLAAA